MQILTIVMLLAAQASGTSQPPDESIGRTASECGMFFMTMQANSTATEQEKSATKYLENLMFSQAKENGISAQEFRQIIEPYKKDLDRRLSEKDVEFIRSEASRCSAFAKSEAQKADAKKPSGS